MAPQGASPQCPFQILLGVQGAEGVGLSSILHVGREPCIQPHLVQALGDGIMFNQELKRPARLANCILYLWPKAVSGWLPPAAPDRLPTTSPDDPGPAWPILNLANGDLQLPLPHSTLCLASCQPPTLGGHPYCLGNMPG